MLERRAVVVVGRQGVGVVSVGLMCQGKGPAKDSHPMLQLNGVFLHSTYYFCISTKAHIQ